MKRTKIRYQTWMEKHDDGTVKYIHHNTAIVTIHPDGSFTLNNGGYYSSTTKKRMNDYIPSGWRIYQKNFDWYIVAPTGETAPYSNTRY